MDYDSLYGDLPKPPKEKEKPSLPASTLQLPDDITDVKELAKLATPDAIRTLHQIALYGVSEAARVAAANAIIDRGHGKAAQAVTLKGDRDNPIALTRIDDLKAKILRAIPNEQLDAILSEADSHGLDDGEAAPDVQQD